MTTEMKKFTPSTDYNTAGVMNLDIRNHDEIGEIYQGIREMQINIVDYLRNLNALEEDKRKAENDLKNKDKQIGELSKETYTDTLTGVGSKAAYAKKINELNQLIKQDPKSLEFALVMVDMNNLKNINDKFGHRAGDNYIQGCCRLICEIFKHSPVYRVGGDEFVAILHGKDYNDRKEKTDKLKAEYEKYGSNEELSPWLRYSAAVGMAEYIVDDKTAESVFRRADKAMYEDKNQFKKKFGGETR
jgi:diguanylate cyclase (GGDEF)-like protein